MVVQYQQTFSQRIECRTDSAWHHLRWVEMLKRLAKIDAAEQESHRPDKGDQHGPWAREIAPHTWGRYGSEAHFHGTPDLVVGSDRHRHLRVGGWRVFERFPVRFVIAGRHHETAVFTTNRRRQNVGVPLYHQIEHRLQTPQIPLSHHDGAVRGNGFAQLSATIHRHVAVIRHDANIQPDQHDADDGARQAKWLTEISLKTWLPLPHGLERTMRSRLIVRHARLSKQLRWLTLPLVSVVGHLPARDTTMQLPEKS